MFGDIVIDVADVPAFYPQGEIRVTSTPRDKDHIKLVPGTRYDYDTGSWRAPLRWPACHAFRGVFGDRLQLGPSITAWATAELEQFVRPVQEVMAAADWDGHPGQKAFQRVGSEWLKRVRYGLLADDMRLGKTIQCAVALEDIYLDAVNFQPPELIHPSLIVSPNSVKRGWVRELKRWAPSLRADMTQGGVAGRRKLLARLDLPFNDPDRLDVVVTNWENLRLHSRLAPFGSIQLSEKERTPGEFNREWMTVIADEAHRGKDPHSKQTRALWAASADAAYRWALTGTPIAKHPGDLWSVLHFLQPDEWPRISAFRDRYCMQAFSPFGGLQIVGLNMATEPELRKTLDLRMLRRTRRQVNLEVPAVFERRDVELSPKERKAYNQMRDQFVAEVNDGEQVVGWNPLTRMLRLLQMASATLVVGEDGSVELTDPSAKLDALMDFLSDIDEPVVVVSSSRKLLKLAEGRLEKAKIEYGAIHGEVSLPERQQFMDRFQAGELPVMLLQSKAGGEGITLNRASTMVFLNRPVSNVEEQQVMARITGFGQEAETLLYVDLVTVDTAEERVFEILSQRKEALEEVLRDRDRLRSLIAK